jgi:CIC family chloride channel protein
LQRLGTRGLGRMPVVDREDPNKLLGMIRRADIITAYNLALTRRSKIVHQTKHVETQSPEGTEFVELTLDAHDPAVGKSIQEIAPALPKECILISIERAGKVLIPHGQTIFQEGDHVTAFLRSDDADVFYATLLKQGTPTPS